MIEIRFFMSNEILKEFIYKVLCKKTIMYGSIISSVSVVLFIYSIYEQNSFLSGVFLVNTLMCTSAVIFTPILALKSLNKENKDKGFKEEIIIIFDEDKISIKEGTFVIDVGYDKIIDYHILDKASVIMLSRTNGIIFSNDGFVRGTLDGCTELINKNYNL